MGLLYTISILSMLLGLWAQMRVKSAYARSSQVRASSGLSGAEAAAALLQRAGIQRVRIERTHGHLSDHYDPRQKVLRLSEAVYSGRDLAALGIAAHEAGHAIQDKENYAPLVMRNGIVPLASIGSNLGMGLIMFGFILGAFQLLLVGVLLFSTVVVFQLVNLPVEYDASARAKKLLLSSGIISGQEQNGVSKVLDAAALTYVAATIGAVLTLLYYLAQLGLFGGGSNE